MKKSILIALVASLTVFTISSCHKERAEQVVVEESYDKTLKVNESVIFTLPTESDGNYSITTAASHAAVSKIEDDLQGNSTYSYTPEKDFVGTDFVIVSTMEKSHQKSGHKKSFKNGGSKSGHCSGSKGQKTNYKLSFYLAIEKDSPKDNANSEQINASN